LAGLQRALLTSGDDTAALQRLAELAAVVPRAADRRLAAMVSAIIVRVRVELARRQL
jgi:copper homeostasis protein CutC